MMVSDTLKLKSIIVDDEWLVRAELVRMLKQFPEMQVVGEAEDVPQAIQLINQINPDVIFLDIQLPGETGFDLLEKFDIKSKIIFVTAYDQYAIRAFEVNALDYLLKPISQERLSKAIQRLYMNETATYKPPHRVTYDDIIYVIINGSLKFIKVSLLKCIIAEGNYSYIFYADKKRELVSKTLREWEEVLPEKYFVRIHRSTIVNFDYVEKVKKCKNYTHLVFIRGIDKPYVMSRRYAVKLKNLLSW